jgi:hypothetical protein
MRTCALIYYAENESDFTQDSNGANWDKFGITKNVKQVLTDNGYYQDKIDISPTQLTLYVLVRNPSSSRFKGMSAEEKAYFEGFTYPFLAFYDVTEERYYGILAKRDATKYNAVKSALDVIANTKEFTDKGYKVQMGNQTYFMQDARNAHLPKSENGNIDPNHSLLDMVYIGADLGIFDRPYLRDFVTNLIDGIKKYWWLGLLGAGAVYYYAQKDKKKKKKGNRVNAIRGVKKNILRQR